MLNLNLRQCLSLALLCFLPGAYANVDLTVKGLNSELQANVDAYLAAISPEEYSTSLRFQSQVEDNVKKALKALGHYNPKIHFEVKEEPAALNVNVDAGPVTRLSQVNILLMGEAASDEDFEQVVSSSPVKKGATLNHSQYDALKSNLRNLALQKGYFEGEFVETALKVVPSKNEAIVDVIYDSGIRYQFGEVTITGSQIRQDRVESLVPFKQSDDYQAKQVGELNQKLSNTDWFSSVHVEPDLSEVGSTRELPINIILAPSSTNQVETGLGYSTDIGVKGTLKWTKPWLNDRGHSFTSNLSISEPEQQVTMGYKIPLEDVLDDYYQIQYGMKNTNKEDTKSFENNIAVERHWKLDSGWHRTLFIRYLFEDYTQGETSNISKMLLPGISFSRIRSRGGSMPYWGDKQVYTLEASDKHAGSDAGIVRAQAGMAWIRSLGQNHRGIARLDGGAIYTDDFDKVPPSLRFFAGGDNNLRGYGYESISPKDSSDSLTGGKFMATGTLEYQYRLVGDWWVAAFFDAGDAWNTTPDWQYGRGVGVRWASPVGPIRLDVAWPGDTVQLDDYRIHFTLGPEL
ncbi:autotransporter assembly complex family protein [Vibrio sp. SCSIO 43136]|uniref:autotransporter assembly complex protein TamA n=1 Tax=Vibrio sp. SCSIO 43136 TaxID=2819101 RepID=UPI002075E1A1|nr:autotransporter assembly complex family protein [Vibrio sp. SCSIO 43136]USD64981.1 outer membrane protein assembly factor [Vibrio sp. SCSIO 43136]